MGVAGGRLDRTPRSIVGNQRRLVGNRGASHASVLASWRGRLVRSMSRLLFSATRTRGFAQRRVGVLRRLRGHRVVGGLLSGFVLAVALSVTAAQCVQTERMGSVGTPRAAALPRPTIACRCTIDAAFRPVYPTAGETPADAPVDAAPVPLCCLALAGCAAPGSPAPRAVRAWSRT